MEKSQAHWNNRILLIGLATAIVFLLLLESASAAPLSSRSSGVGAAPIEPSADGAPASSRSTGAPTNASALADAALRAAHREGIPSRFVYVPRSGPAPLPVRETGNHTEPTYPAAPAPMGIADFGLVNRSGSMVATLLNSTSLEGTFATDSKVGLQPEYLDSGVPDAYGVQLNAVLTNVMLNGSTSTDGVPNEFWTQNVVQYAAQLHELQFIDNVWSFSPGFNSDTFQSYGPNGTFVDPEYYYGLGPTISISYPFTLRLYLNSTVVHGENAVFFNYTLTNASTTRSGSYDYVVFNSGGTAAPGGAEYQADGFNYDPVGLPNDFEFVIGGPGGGSTTDFLAAEATMTLEYWNDSTHRYVAVPSAFNTGGETGETSSGADVWYSGTTAEVSSGPAIATGLWNASGVPGGNGGAGTIHLRVSPSNAFVFVAPATAGGTWTDPTAQWQWAPRVGGSFAGVPGEVGPLRLPRGQYTVAVLLSGYAPLATPVSVGSEPLWLNVSLVADPAVGTYTPLFAWSDAQLAGASAEGSGTSASPYRLDPMRNATIGPLFGGFNDYGFPTFAGLEILNTTAHVVAVPEPLVAPVPSFLAGSATLLDVPMELGLATWILDSQYVALVNGTFQGIWFGLASEYADPADAMLFDSAHVLIANDTFDVGGGTGLFVYDAGDWGAGTVTIWGNDFQSVSVADECHPFCFGIELPTLGLDLMSDGQLVYNNIFWTDVTAETPTSNWWSLVSAPPVLYTDRWNVTPQRASNVRTVSGFPWFPLSGSIVGGTVQGGNYWVNYGSSSTPFGDLPYDNGGLITVGGDFAPLFPYALYAVSVSVWAPSHDSWVVEVGSLSDYGWDFNGTAGGSGASVLPNGTYTANGYLVIPGMPVTNPGAQLAASATFVVNGSAVNVTLQFESDYLVVFQPYGYDVIGTPWGICIDTTPWGGPSPYTYSGGTLWAALPNGTFNYTSYVIDFSSWGLSGPGCASVPLLNVTVAAPVGTITVNGSDEVIPVEFNETFPISFYATGVPDDDEWQVNDTPYPAQAGWGSGPLVLDMINGTYRRPYASLEPSILPYAGGRWGNVSFTVAGAAENVSVAFGAGVPVTFQEHGFPGNQGVRWSVRIDATNYSSYLTTIVAYVPNGTFGYRLSAGESYTGQAYIGDPATGRVTVRNGEPEIVDVRFAAVYVVQFNESGLPAGTFWGVNVNGHLYRSSGSSIELDLTNGTYVYLVRAPHGYDVRPASGVFRVHGHGVQRNLTFRASDATTPGEPDRNAALRRELRADRG